MKDPTLFSVTENENNKLPAGKYTYKETFAPDGYLINEESFSFEFKKDGEIIKHMVKGQKKQTSPIPDPST